MWLAEASETEPVLLTSLQMQTQGLHIVKHCGSRVSSAGEESGLWSVCLEGFSFLYVW